MSFLRSLLPVGRRSHEQAGFRLYAAAVAAARQPHFYATLGVPDTLNGRFDMVALFTALIVERLRTATEPGPALAQAVFDAMFADMDVNLREMGVGDLSVGKKNRAMWEAFHGRALAYGPALDAADQPALAAAIRRNVWRGCPVPDGSAAALASHTMRLHAHLAEQSLDALATGDVCFRPLR